MPHRINGCCVLCDEPMYEVVTTWPSMHLRGSEPRQLGAPVDVAERVTFQMVDGSTADMTFCGDCADQAKDRLPEIWAKAMGALWKNWAVRANVLPWIWDKK